MRRALLTCLKARSRGGAGPTTTPSLNSSPRLRRASVARIRLPPRHSRTRGAARSLAVGANASSQTRYYSDLGDFLDGIHAGGVGFEASLGSRTRIQAQQTIGFSPLFAVNPFPVLGTPDLGASVPPNADLTLAQRDSRLLGTTAGFSHVLDGRSSLGAGYGYSSSAYSGEIPRPPVPHGDGHVGSPVRPKRHFSARATFFRTLDTRLGRRPPRSRPRRPRSRLVASGCIPERVGRTCGSASEPFS